jgi:restriction system protein
VARHRSFVSTMAQIQREAVRAQAAQSRARSAQIRAQAQAEAARARAHTAQLKAAAADEREQKRLYAEARNDEVVAMNDELAEKVSQLENVLPDGLRQHPALRFETLKESPPLPEEFHRRWETPEPAPQLAEFLPPEPAGLSKMFGKAKHDREMAAAQQAHAEAVTAHAARELQRTAQFTRAKTAYDSQLADQRASVSRQHADVDAFATAYRAGDPAAVVNYCELVLAGRLYPDNIEPKFKIAYVPESQQAVIEYELPSAEVVPTVKSYRYVRTTDTIAETGLPATRIKALYASLVSQLTLRTVGEIFAADIEEHIGTIVFNGVVDTIDPGSGQPIRPCLITLRTTREVFNQLDLARVEPLACLKHLSASVSKSPAELVPVRPVLEFSMVDPRFIAESDALTLLDERPNLLELTPGEFEVLVQNLFTRMGLEAKQTRASRDGGVDCVAYDVRPILGGKVVIQAKRYKNTVGVSAVRDLFGTLQNEGASKGILVTTSGYGAASFEFARNKPIELIDGAGLLYLLKAHADIDARIEAPEDWHDPVPDSGE